MSENQYLANIENKIDSIAQVIDQQTKSGVFFDGFTKQVLENINSKLDSISDFEANELINFLKGELKRTIEERHNTLQSRLEGMQSQITTVQANLGDSLKSSEMITVFTSLSDSVLEFSRDLSAQTKYFNSTVENIQTELGRIDVSNKIDDQTSKIQTEISSYKTNIENLSYDINSSFDSVKRLIESNTNSEAILALSGDVSVLQKGLNDIINAVLAMNSKQGEIITNISNISSNVDVQDIKLDVSSMLAEIQALKDSVRVLVNKADVEAINERISYAIDMISSFRSFADAGKEENKVLFGSYFNDLSILISSLVSKEEGSIIENKLGMIQSGLESGHQNVREMIEQNNNELRNIIPVISSLSTKENIRELSENAVRSINEMTNRWIEDFSQNALKWEGKFTAFENALSNIYETLSGIIAKVEANGGSDELIIKEEVSSIISHVNNMSEQVSSSTRNSVFELQEKINNIHLFVDDRISKLEGLFNGLNDGLKGSLFTDLNQLKDFSQNLVEIINSFGGKIDVKAEEVKQVLNERYENLVEKINQLFDNSAALNLEQKVEITNSIETLRQIVEASKSALENDKTYSLLNEKITYFEGLLNDNKNIVLSSNEQVLYAMSAQNNLIENINNAVKDLQVNITESSSLSSANKENIIGELSQKIYSVNSLINEIKYQITNDLIGNKDCVINEISELKTASEDIKNILNEVNENQASKQILSAILENVTSKLEQVSILVGETKDFNLDQYDNIKNLTNSLKSEIDNVFVLLTQSSQFAQNMMDRMSSGFVDVSNKIVSNIESLKNDFSAIAVDNKTEIIGLVEKIAEDIKTVQSNVASFNFDETVKQQLLDLKQQIEAFSHQSLVDILNEITENNEKTGQNVISTIEKIKVDFETIFSQINNLQTVIFSLKTDLQQNLVQNFNELNNKIEEISSNIEAKSSSNKEEILAEITKLLEFSNQLTSDVQLVNENIVKDNFIVEQTIKINNHITDFATTIEKKLDDINNNDKGYLSEVIKGAFVDFQQQVVEAINYLKSLNLNLDRSLTGAKNTILENLDVVKENSINGLEAITSSKTEIISEIENATNKIENKIIETQEKTEIAKESLLTQISGALSQNVIGLKTDFELKLRESIDALGEKISVLTGGLHTNSEKNKDQIVKAVEETKTVTEEVKIDITNLIETTREDIKQNVISEVSAFSKINKEELLAEAQVISTSLADIKINLNQISETTANIDLQKVNEKIETVAEKISVVTEENKNEISNIITDVSSLLNTIEEDIKIIKEGTINEEIKALDEKIEKLRKELSDIANVNKGEITTFIEKIPTTINEIKAIVQENIKEEAEFVNSKFVKLEEDLISNYKKTNNLTLEIKQIIDSSLINVTEKLTSESCANDEFRENLKFELKKTIDEITNKMFTLNEDGSSLKEELLYELQKTFNVLSNKVDNQIEKADKLQIGLEDGLQSNLETIQEKIKITCAEIQSGLVKNLVNELDFEELKAEITKNVLESISSLDSHFNDLNEIITNKTSDYEALSKLNKNEILAQIGLLKEDLSKIKIEEKTPISDELKVLEDKLQSISDDILDALSNDLDASFTDNIKLITEAVEDKVSYIKDDIQEIVLKLSNVDSIVEKIKDFVTVNFEDYFASIDSKIDILGENIKKYFEKNIVEIKDKIEEYQKEVKVLADIDLSAYSEDVKHFISAQIIELNEKIEALNNATTVDSILIGVDDTVKTSAEEINKRLVALREIILAEIPNGEEISDNFDEIKTALNDISFKTKGIESVIKDENASLKEIIERFQEGMSALSGLDAVSSDTEETKGFIKKELKNLKEQFVKSLATVFENVSFIEESEEIQNVIFDNADEIKSEINKLKNDLIENSNSNDDIDKKFDNLKSILESITTGSDSASGRYIYTLPDVETDIAKMRMAIGDITEMLKRSQDDENDVAGRLNSIDDIRDDISSISKRTNKLILTSEDANKYLRENIAEFKEVIDSVNDKCKKIDNTYLLQNIEDVKSLVLSTLKSDRILNEAFMHLAEWIDDSAKTMNSISEQAQDNKDNIKELKRDIEKLDDKTDEITRVKEAIIDLTNKFERKFDTDYSKFLYDIECGLDKISDKLEVQELKIKSLEKKLDNMANSPIGGEEVGSILEFIASQVSAANENSRSNKLLLQKVELMEKQMNQFENNISKITAFIDGVN